MPIIASVTIPINVKEDHTIELLFLDEIKKCGCINIQSALQLLDIPLDELRDTIGMLVGEKAIVCDEKVCCISENYHNLVAKLRELS